MIQRSPFRQLLSSSAVSAVKTYGNKQAIQHHYINFDYVNHTIEWRGEIYHLEPNVLVHFKASEKSIATEAGVLRPICCDAHH